MHRITIMVWLFWLFLFSYPLKNFKIEASGENNRETLTSLQFSEEDPQWAGSRFTRQRWSHQVYHEMHDPWAQHAELLSACWSVQASPCGLWHMAVSLQRPEDGGQHPDEGLFFLQGKPEVLSGQCKKTLRSKADRVFAISSMMTI